MAMIPFVLAGGILSLVAAQADQPYAGGAHLSDEGPTTTVTHIHSLGHKSEGLRAWYAANIRNLEECAWTSTGLGILQVYKDSKRTYCTAVPLLTHLWLSPDEEYIVGLSTILDANRHHLVVYSVDGELIHRQAIDCEQLKSHCNTTVSQYIYWFHETHPAIQAKETDDGTVVLSLNDPYKQRATFRFPRHPAQPLDRNACGRNWGPYSIEYFWHNLINGFVGIIETHQDVVCIYEQRGKGRNYYYVTREDFDNRNIRERGYTQSLTLEMSRFRDDPQYSRQHYPRINERLARLTGLRFAALEDWLGWWNLNKDRLVLSEDGQHLVFEETAVSGNAVRIPAERAGN